MNRITIYMFILFITGTPVGLTYHAVAQTGVDARLGFSCGFAGQPSPLVQAFNKLIEEDDLDQLVALVNSGTPAQQCLAVMTCELLESQGRLKLSRAIRDKIVFLYRSNQKIPICNGCMLGSTLTMSELLRPGSALSFGHSARNWVKKQLLK